MRALIQRVKKASVTVKKEKISEITGGLLIFLGITHDDTEKDIQYLIDKILNLRVFEAENGKLDLSLLDVQGEMLVVSQFTLYGKCDKGRRPDFTMAASVENAQIIYNKAVEFFQKCPIKVEFGEFQAHMEVEIINDGPLTLMLESKK